MAVMLVVVIVVLAGLTKVIITMIIKIAVAVRQQRGNGSAYLVLTGTGRVAYVCEVKDQAFRRRGAQGSLLM